MFTTITLAAAALVSMLAASTDAALISKCNTAKTIAITFDDAFQHPQLEDLLADLAKYQITATFFLVPSGDGSFCESVKKILAGGHTIGNHTWSHGHVGSMSASQLQDEIKKVEQAVAQCGITQKMTLFRPPYLETGGSVMSVAGQMGYDVVTCNVDSQDYNNIALNQAWSNVQNGISAAGGSAVVLEHNWTYRSSGTKGIIQKYAETYKAQGYRFVSINECAGKGPSPTTAPTTAPTSQPTTQPTTAPTSSPGGGANRWGQCGGIGWNGPTTCAEGSCVKFNDYYSQCQ